MSVKGLFALAAVVALTGIAVRLAGGTENLRGSYICDSDRSTDTCGFLASLLFPPVNTNANVSVGIDQGCVQILDNNQRGKMQFYHDHRVEVIIKPCA
jgi:hypothetical protein